MALFHSAFGPDTDIDPNKAHRGNNQAIFALQVLYEKVHSATERGGVGGWVGKEVNARMESVSERNLLTL